MPRPASPVEKFMTRTLLAEAGHGPVFILIRGVFNAHSSWRPGERFSPVRCTHEGSRNACACSLRPANEQWRCADQLCRTCTVFDAQAASGNPDNRSPSLNATAGATNARTSK